VQSRAVDKAEAVLQLIFDKAFKLNCVILIGGYCSSDKWKEAAILLEQMAVVQMLLIMIC